MSNINGNIGEINSSIISTFRIKAQYMKSWKPKAIPSNRDRLELYALHKQAISGDAPTTFPGNQQTASQSDKAKYQAWRNKRGINQENAMSYYINECDRQIRVYGNIPTITNSAQAQQQQLQQQQQSSNISNTSVGTGTSVSQSSQNSSTNTVLIPRGLAAIPLLCAAASESRISYLRRLSHTPIHNSWWSRQEPLCGTPGTIYVIPETILLIIASLNETISLGCEDYITLLPSSVIRSFLWPYHNCFLVCWILLIIINSILTSSLMLIQTLLWGQRRTQISLKSIWNNDIKPTIKSINTCCGGSGFGSNSNNNQMTNNTNTNNISIRLVGLFLLPYNILIDGIVTNIIIKNFGLVSGSLFYVIINLFFMWWYYLLFLPWLSIFILLGFGCTISGICFALIDISSSF